MGRAKRLTAEEIGRIKALHEEGYSMRNIARKVGRSHQVVSNLIHDPENYGKHYKGRTKFITTKRERRAILREASNSALTARQIARNVGTKASLRTVQKILQQAPLLKRSKIKRRPVLKEHHCIARLQFARDHMSWTTKWHTVVFSDEKKFNLDGPDGFSYYFHDLRKEQLIASRRRADVGSVMVWGAISYNGSIDLVILKGRQKSENYIRLLESVLDKCKKIRAGQSFIWQHDNASIHSAKIVKSWFRENNVQVLEWPALSPDLNIIENVWGWLSRQLYSNAKQYNNAAELQQALLQKWDELPISYIRTLYTSLPDRMFEVIRNNGKNTHY